MSTRGSVIGLTMRINGILNARYLPWLAGSDGRWQLEAFGKCPLDELMLQRLKRFPMLLVDCHFDDATWWDQRLGEQTVPVACSDERIELGRDVLTALWCLLDDGPEFHCLTGIAPAVSALWDRAGFNQIVGAGRCWCAEFQPRWGDVPTFWHRLLCDSNGDSEWDLAQLQALQLCGRHRTAGTDISQ